MREDLETLNREFDRMGVPNYDLGIHRLFTAIAMRIMGVMDVVHGLSGIPVLEDGRNGMMQFIDGSPLPFIMSVKDGAVQPISLAMGFEPSISWGYDEKIEVSIGRPYKSEDQYRNTVDISFDFGDITISEDGVILRLDISLYGHKVIIIDMKWKPIGDDDGTPI